MVPRAGNQAEREREPVGIVWIVCPTSGRHVATGIETEEREFSKLPGLGLTYECADCGETHAWGDTQAAIVDEAIKRLIAH
jgi:hypothetical protein